MLGNLTAYSLLPSEVGEWAEQPLRVLLENARDGVLVRLAVSVSNSEKLQESLEKGWLRPEGRGGSGEVKNAIKEAKVSHRLFVLIDSDRELPEGEISKTARDISRLCEGKFPLHVLERREIENYVPDAVWELLVADLPRSKITRASGVEHRAVLVYRWLLRLIEREQELAAKYGRDALELVISNLQRKAERALPGKFFHELLAEWKALTPKARGVDDMKVRFGRGYAEIAVQKLNDDNFDLSWIDAEALEELCSIARKLEDWL